jgi:hypothetical protein
MIIAKPDFPWQNLISFGKALRDHLDTCGLVREDAPGLFGNYSEKLLWRSENPGDPQRID